MARVIVACPHCKARFDVSSFKPGSKIRCGSCYKILVIPRRGGGQAEGSAKEKKAPPKKREVPAARSKKRAAASRGDEGKVSVASSGKGDTESPTVVDEKTPPEHASTTAAAKDTPTAAKAPQKKPEKPGDPLIGKKINGEFEMVRMLGQGGYGTVYEAVDMSLKRRVAVKLMLREKTTNKEFVAKFLREARTAAQLSHPNIVKIHLVGFCKDLSQHFLAMEYVEGKTVSDILSDEGALSLDRAVDIIIQAANGLAEAHRKNIIHRDIKPGNVMITPKGVVKIADFGLAKIYDPDDAASMVIGTPYFMPPEQFEGKARDGRTDIYALGVTFYFALTLRRPFDGKTPAQVLLNVMQKDPVSPKEYNPDIPENICAVIKKMIARKLSDRYSTCEELLRDLKNCQADHGHGEEAVFCPACGIPNRFAAQKCAECATSLLEPCPKCGTPDSVGAKFCGNCGANLAEERQVAAMLAEAESHEAAGRLEDALEKYREARDASPDNSQVVEGLRRAEQIQAERDDAVAHVNRLLLDGNFLEALKAVEEAGERFPEYAPLQEAHDRAKEGAKDARLGAALDEARVLLESGDLLSACEAARRAVEIDPDSESARALLGEAEDAADRYHEARARACELEDCQRLHEALAAWREARELTPEDEAAEQAIERIEGVLGQVDRLRARGEAALESSDLGEARSTLEDAAGILPSDLGTLKALKALRKREAALLAGLEASLQQVAEGQLEKGSETLEGLRQEFPLSEMVARTVDRLAGIVAGVKFLRTEAEAQLLAKRPGLAMHFAGLVKRFDPDDDTVDALLESAHQHDLEYKEQLKGIRREMNKDEFAKAAEELATLGGVLSQDAEIAEMAHAAAEGMFERQQAARERKDAVLEAALCTARELVESGRYHAAELSCQKALRIDRMNEEARALKAEIAAHLEEDEVTGTESRIETGFFDIEGLEEEA